MTTTEAIKQLQTEHDLIASERELDGSQFAPALLEALAMAIEVMQGDGDTISRKAAIDALLEEVRLIDGYYVENDEVIDKDDAIEAIRLLSSAQPENDWIPCTKKAHPDTPFRVQVQMDNGWIITAYYQDGEWLSVPDCGEPLLDKWIEAWRELPEPYKEGEQDG